MRRWYVWVPISVALLALIVWRTRPWDAAALAARLDPVPLLIAVALNGVIVVTWAVRSKSLMAEVGHHLSVRALVPVVSFANTINNLTPASSGEVLRAAILRRRHDIPYKDSAAVIIAERLWAIGIILVTALAAAVGTLIEAPPWLIALAWLGAAVAAFLPSIVYALHLRPGKLAQAYADRGGDDPGRMHTLARDLAMVDERLGQILTHPGRAVHFVLTSCAIFIAMAGQLWLVLFALGESVSVVGAWACLGLSTCAGVISALPFGLGAADLVLVLLLGSLGVDAASAGAATLLFRLVATLPMGVLGWLSWIYLSRSREAAAEASEPGDRIEIDGSAERLIR